MVTRLAGGGSAGFVASGSIDGTGSAALFTKPSGLTVSSAGTVYVADAWNHLIRMITPTGTNIAIITMHLFIPLWVHFSVVVN